MRFFLVLFFTPLKIFNDFLFESIFQPILEIPETCLETLLNQLPQG